MAAETRARITAYQSVNKRISIEATNSTAGDQASQAAVATERRARIAANQSLNNAVNTRINRVSLTPGPKGNTGPRGLKGDRGEAGPQGPSGSAGLSTYVVTAEYLGPAAGYDSLASDIKAAELAVTKAHREVLLNANACAMTQGAERARARYAGEVPIQINCATFDDIVFLKAEEAKAKAVVEALKTEVVAQTSPLQLQPQCDNGDSPIGGGFSNLTGKTVVTNNVDSLNSGWIVERTGGQHLTPWSAKVICLKLQP